MGISAIIAVCVIVAGGIGVASYVRYRNTLFSQSVWSLFLSVMIALLGVLLLMFPAVGVATIAWVFGIGVVLFGVVQLVAARPFFLVGAGLVPWLAFPASLKSCSACLFACSLPRSVCSWACSHCACHRYHRVQPAHWARSHEYALVGALSPS